MSNKSFYVICVVMLINAVVSSTTWVFLPVYFKERGGTEIDVGAMWATYTFTGAFLALPFGRISDRVGRKPVLIFSLLGYSLSWTMILFFRSIQWFYISMIVRGPFIFLASTVTAFIADMFDAEKRGGVMGIYQSLNIIGSIIGPISAGLIIASFFYEGYFLFATGTALASLFLAAFLVKESNADATSIRLYLKSLKDTRIVKPRFIRLRLFSVLAQNKILVKYYLARLCVVGRQMIFGLFPIFLKSVLGLGVFELGLMQSVTMIVTMIASPFLGKTSDRFGRKPLLYAGFLATACTTILYTRAQTFNEMLLLRSIDVVAMSVTTMAGDTFLADLLPASHRGLGINLFTFLNSLLGAFASMLGGFIAVYYGWSFLLYVSAGISFTGFMLWFMVPEHRQPPAI